MNFSKHMISSQIMSSSNIIGRFMSVGRIHVLSGHSSDAMQYRTILNAIPGWWNFERMTGVSSPYILRHSSVEPERVERLLKGEEVQKFTCTLRLGTRVHFHGETESIVNIGSGYWSVFKGADSKAFVFVHHE